ncbi:efflux RND transporter periplasmic adaptor subunit [Blastopirellula marina]|uniref:Uncharacterized protein n=1 Tax=Blastopirellula marina TaxID=124 RepID=A0A2S8GQY2_9BACT|nr:efflux RND transporter periplasmic adaptor subunit [Blastopirellula marina]PQO46827.1 hypothetical protein C5Y93_06660 [Blastopirellula marina]
MYLGKAFALLLFCCLFGCQVGGLEETRQADDDDDVGSLAGTVRLEEAAQEAVGIQTALVALQPLPEVLKLSGWLAAIPGKESVVKARVTGIYEAKPEGAGLAIGVSVASGENLGSLRTVLTPQEETQLVLAKEEADVLMNQALVSKQLAENQLRAIEQNDANNAIAGSRLLELRETIARNEVAYQEARDKLSFLPNEPYANQLELRSVSLTAPFSGQISTVNVAANQLVIQGDPLWTVSDWTELWIKAPVFVEDLPRLSADKEAAVRQPGSRETTSAQRVDVAVASAPGRRTSDLYFLVQNPAGNLRPGHPVELELTLSETADRLVVPRSAIVWDGMGNAWLYVKTGEEEFLRRQVTLGPGNEDFIAVEQGVREGEEIVVQGAQSIYGEEFKGQLQVEDDD